MSDIDHKSAYLTIQYIAQEKYIDAHQLIKKFNVCLMTCLILRYINAFITLPDTNDVYLLDQIKLAPITDQLDTQQFFSDYIENHPLPSTDEDKKIKFIMVFLLGTWYDRVTNDINEAVRLWQWAANNDNVAAMYNLAWCYENGAGLPYDPANSAHLYRAAGLCGYPKAHNNLGVLYYTGKGVPQDEVEAIKHFELAAKFGNLSAMFNLAHAYHKGRGVAKNIDRAVSFYTDASNRGHIGSAYNLALCLCYEDDIKQKPHTAVQLLNKNSQLQDPDSMSLLGYWYINGTFVEQDIRRGHQLIMQAKSLGCHNYASHLTNMDIAELTDNVVSID
jgi:hypothetical protein